jgi:single-strand DNA-binding protein
MKLIGLCRLGRDGELRRLPSGESVVNLALAYNYGKKGEDGNKPTQWVDASFWGTRAEALSQYLVKGQLFLVEVRDVHVETYAKNDGSSGVKLVGTVDNIEFAGSAPGQGGGGQQAPQQRQAPAAQGQQRQAPQGNQGYGNAPAQQPRQQPAQNQQRPQGQGGSGFDDMDSDIPF